MDAGGGRSIARSEGPRILDRIFSRPSRRDFLKLTSAWLALAGSSSCRWPDEPADERSEIHLLRADDLLSLRFRFHNLRIVHRRGRPANLVRIRAEEDALVVVELPGQHVAEPAFPDDADSGSGGPVRLPLASRMAGPSRLVFKLPAGADQVPLTLESLLDWKGWVASLASGERGADGVRPAPDQTAIELPFRLVLSPDARGRWTHATRPVTHGGRTELWHTRLASSAGGPPGVVVVWSPDHPEPGPEGMPTSLSPRDRRDLVGRSATARTLLLSPMGGWLDVRGEWEAEADTPLEKWHHVATAGQDQRVVVQRGGGFLFPFGHRAALVEVTERRSEHVEGRAVACLRQRHFVVVKQAEVEYRHGRMAFRTITAVDRVTPSLRFDAGRRPEELKHFWIETGADRAFPFRFRGEDWAGRAVVFDAPAVFLGRGGDPGAARALYEQARYADRRVRPMQGQAAAVARFDPGDGGKADRWGEPLPNPRSEGDTTLDLLRIVFAADPAAPAPDQPPFSTRTAGMQVRVPSLAPYLSDAVNRGWFTLVDPDSEANLGEVFAQADPGRGEAKIPLYFDQQSDRCGGVASPSFDVAGLSRVRGPVGDTAPLYRGGAFDPERYFTPGRAQLLGGLPLAKLLAASPPGEAGSPAIPRISLSLARRQPDEDEGGDARPYREVELGLSWSVPLKSSEPGRFAFVATGDGSKSALTLGVRLTRRLGGAAPEPKPDAGGGEPKPKDLGVDWSVSGRLAEFALRMDAGELGRLSIGFDHLALKLSTPKTRTREGRERKEGGAEIDFKLSHVHTEGPLVFLELLLALVTHLPPLPELPESEASVAYPATLPGVGDADLGVTLGPFQAPATKWGRFALTNAAVSVGVGFYFAGRPPLFTLRLASQDKPLTLMAEPWGGIAHAGVNFSGRELTGFQAALGIVYKLEGQLGGSRATIEGSLSCTFTYLVTDAGREHRVDVVLRVVGQATIFGFVEVQLTLMAAGTWQDEQWFFAAAVTVRARIGFFAMNASYAFTYRLSGGSGGDRLAAAAPAASEARLSEAEWLAYEGAFAGA
jgi:hypothetical protein